MVTLATGHPVTPGKESSRGDGINSLNPRYVRQQQQQQQHMETLRGKKMSVATLKFFL